MVESACASAGLSGPTTRSVGGAVEGEADVGGGGVGLSWPLHAVCVVSASPTNRRTPFALRDIGFLFEIDARSSLGCFFEQYFLVVNTLSVRLENLLKRHVNEVLPWV